MLYSFPSESLHIPFIPHREKERERETGGEGRGEGEGERDSERMIRGRQKGAGGCGRRWGRRGGGGTRRCKERSGDSEEKFNVNSLLIISRISISESGMCLNM